MTTYLFSAFVFSLSSHALIKASLFSISIFANNTSEKKNTRKWWVFNIYLATEGCTENDSKKQTNHRHIYLCQLNSLHLSLLRGLQSLRMLNKFHMLVEEYEQNMNIRKLIIFYIYI